jgi:hypothetical protein
MFCGELVHSLFSSLEKLASTVLLIIVSSVERVKPIKVVSGGEDG